jgi:hypothetical protein
MLPHTVTTGSPGTALARQRKSQNEPNPGRARPRSGCIEAIGSGSSFETEKSKPR